MISEEEYNRLTAAFALERKNAHAFAAAHNRRLPTRRCPSCKDGVHGHVPGLVCAACGYRHSVSWAYVKDTEHGYDVVGIGRSRRVYASFVVIDFA